MSVYSKICPLCSRAAGFAYLPPTRGLGEFPALHEMVDRWYAEGFAVEVADTQRPDLCTCRALPIRGPQNG